jgi:hypothetical protein
MMPPVALVQEAPKFPAITSVSWIASRGRRFAPSKVRSLVVSNSLR